MINRKLLFTLVIATTLSAHSSAQTLKVLPDGTWATDITPDGSLVVGSSSWGGFYWDWKTEPAPTYVPGGYGFVGVSDDGLTMAGNMLDPGGSDDVAAIWTLAGGWVSLGELPFAQSCPSKSKATGISGDGSTIVGLSWDGCSARGFKWTAAAGMQELEHLGATNNNANAISGDGSSIGGYGDGAPGQRSPAVWASDLTGAMLDSAAFGEIYGFNADGSIAVGTQYFGAGWFGAFYSVNGGSPINLGSLNNGTMAGRARGVSEQGEIIVGYDLAGLDTEAWVWTQATGIVGLNALLLSLGITGAPKLQQSTAVSDDGTVVVGGALGSTGFNSNAGFIAEFTSTGTWSDLGHALAGALGDPVLTGGGDLLPFSTVNIALSAALPNGSAWLLIGLSALNAPFKAGVLVPSPDMTLGPLAIDGTGSLSMSSFWPAGVPSGFTSYFQYWIPDAAGVQGFAASNGLGATTP
ncbi:MAG: hypothetical protein DRQ55_12065 [Planctomycetota bacterium]|nr:MAG: hypothetical protein DRQ55_12065 [Planctomycetota bacterium]